MAAGSPGIETSVADPFESIRYWDRLRNEKRWWHSFEFPDGSTVEGVCSLAGLRNRIDQFPIPAELRGKRVLDIGTWDGWYAFEMERRGAEVVAIDCWDNPLFHEAHARLGSRVEYGQFDVYDLTPERIGRFDIVLFMGVLYHLKHPLLALERVCALTTDMAAVESFILRERHRPGDDVERRPVMEFYETDEMGGQIDCWTAPSLPCLMAFCRTAGFARAELCKVLEHSASVACYRRWPAPPANAEAGPELVDAFENNRNGINFDSRRDDYLSIWFDTAAHKLQLDDVRPQVDGYGVRPVFLGATGENHWHANFRLPPGLTPGWHDVTVRIGDSLPSNSKPIAVDLPLSVGAIELTNLSDGESGIENELNREKGNTIVLGVAGLPENADRNNVRVYLAGRRLNVARVEKRDCHGHRQVHAEVPVDVPPGPAQVEVASGDARTGAADLLILTPLRGVDPMNVTEKIREIRQRMEVKAPAEAAMEGNAARRREELNALYLSYSCLHRLRHAVGTMPPVPSTIRGRAGSYLVRAVQRMLFWYTPQILRFQDETVRALDRICQLLELEWKEAEEQREQMKQLQLEVSRLRAEVAAHGDRTGPAAE